MIDATQKRYGKKAKQALYDEIKNACPTRAKEIMQENLITPEEFMEWKDEFEKNPSFGNYTKATRRRLTTK